MSSQVASEDVHHEPAVRPVRPPAFTVLLILALVLLGCAIIAITIGAAGIPFSRLLSALGLTAPAEAALFARDQLVLWSIRIPRIVVTGLVGAMLAVAGAIMQGLFRNPLADPALVGVSSGGAFAAAAAIVYTDSQYGQSIKFLQFELLPIAAFLGSLITTFILYRIASRGGRTSVAIFLLSGLAIAALANAGLGLLVFIADDRQLRDITFWLLGSLAGSTWSKAAVIAPIAFVALSAVLWFSRDLDLLVLGEAEAFHSGVNVQRLKTISIVAVSALTGAAVSVAGVIGFVGIVVPHVLRLAVGPGHRLLMPAAAILGAALMVFADTLARTLAAPAEVPIGILTAAIGAPFFLAIVLRQRSAVGL
ncbi:MAG: FecCD family ABC transporter permease [Pseudomonadota bacterium]